MVNVSKLKFIRFNDLILYLFIFCCSVYYFYSMNNILIFDENVDYGKHISIFLGIFIIKKIYLFLFQANKVLYGETCTRYLRREDAHSMTLYYSFVEHLLKIFLSYNTRLLFFKKYRYLKTVNFSYKQLTDKHRNLCLTPQCIVGWQLMKNNIFEVKYNLYKYIFLKLNIFS